MRIVIVILLMLSSANAAEFEIEFDALLEARSDSLQEVLLQSILSMEPSWEAVYARIESLQFGEIEKRGELELRQTICIDGVERPWVLYVPEGYDHEVPTPLLVVLHGGVGHSTITDDPLGYAVESQFKRLAEEKGWLALFPFGQAGATWWDEVGMENVLTLIRTVKREINVDDDRVWMAGFSDGASAGFAFAMLKPTDFGAIVALNGHMGVGSLVGDLPTYAPSLSSTPIYAITTQSDGLYPSDKMRATITMAREAGGELLYRELEGRHEFSYAEQELPRIGRFLSRHPRDPIPNRIAWETTGGEFGRCRWFVVDELVMDDPAPWHKEFNATMIDDRIVIGFMADDSFEGPGVRVDELAGEGTLAHRAGLKPGDVIIRGGKGQIATMDDLGAFKKTLSRGDFAEVTVMRDGSEVVLKGQIPEMSYHYVFKRQRPSGMAKVSFAGNRVDVETSRVKTFRILVHPDLFNLHQKIVVAANGETVFNDFVQPDVEFLLRSFLSDRDRQQLFVGEIRIDLGVGESS